MTAPGGSFAGAGPGIPNGGPFRVGLDLYPGLDEAYRPFGHYQQQHGQHGRLSVHHHHHHQQQQQQQQHQVIAHGPAAAAPRIPSSSSAGQFGVLTPMPAPRGGLLLHQDDDNDEQPAGQHDAAAPFKKPVVGPPDLQAWRERLFHVDDTLVLTHQQFETYFPHVDNVYSHRSTQRYKRKPFVSHYWDCRMKGRPPGTPKSDDPGKKKRKRSARERDLCDVKIKITEYFPGAGTAAAAAAGEAEAAVDRDVAAAVAAGQRFFTIQRVNGNGGNGKGDGVAGPHKHTLAKSDEIKKNSVQRYVAQQEKEAKKTEKLSQRKATGAALLTAKKHNKDGDLKLYAASFCPFSQRVWIALEAKGLAYQYVETDPFRQPAPTPLLEANPRGRVPAIRQGEWACAESAVVLEYLEDVYNAVPLYPSDPRLKANCRLWIDHINTNIVPSFLALLQATTPHHQLTTTTTSTTTTDDGMQRLQSHLTSLVIAADEHGPFFLGPSLSLVDVHFAPFALRLARILRHRCRAWADPLPGTRWHRWLDALERDPHVRATTSTDDVYLDTADLLLKDPVLFLSGAAVAPMG